MLSYMRIKLANCLFLTAKLLVVSASLVCDAGLQWDKMLQLVQNNNNTFKQKWVIMQSRARTDLKLSRLHI